MNGVVNGVLTRRSTGGVPNLASVFENFFNDPFFAESRPATVPAAGALPVDVSEDETSLIVRASLPGFSKEQVDVQVHDGVLTIRGERSEEKTEQTERYHRRERRTGSVSRMISLPDTVSAESVKGELKDGVLTVRLAKTPKAQPRKVQID